MFVVGIVGMPGSGKTEATKIARKKGFPIVKMGDVIRNEVEKRGLNPTDKNMGRIATELREKDGKDAIAKRCINEIYSKIDSKHDIIIIDGLRGWSEAKFFKEEFGESFILVSIKAPFEERFKRIKQRNREDDLSNKEELRRRDEREKSYSMKKAMDKADYIIKNNVSLEEYRKKISEFIEEVKK